MRKIFKLHNIGLMLIIAIVSIFSITKVNAVQPSSWENNNNSITISREITNVTNPVTNTFTYSITADSNNPVGATNVPSPVNIVFDGTESIINNTVTKTGTINFANMSFEHPGTYNYTIAESITSDASIYPKDTTNTYTATIFVENVLDANDVPTGNIKATLLLKQGANKIADYTARFTGSASLSAFGNLKLSKTVTGNIADTADYFEYTITINGTSDTYNITGLTSSITYEGIAKANPTTITGGTPTKVYLKHGDIATIGVTNNLNAIPTSATYSIVETTTAPAGYTASYKINNGSAVSSAAIANESIVTGDNVVAYTNNKNSSYRNITYCYSIYFTNYYCCSWNITIS